MSYLITYDAWLKRTHLRFRPRSDLLKALDARLEGYHLLIKGPTPIGHISRRFVETAFAEWKKSKGPGLEWRRSNRNNDYVMDELTMSLTGEVYDPSVGPKEVGGMDNARQGIIYLFSSMDVYSNLFNVVLEGGLSVAGSALEFKGTAEGGSHSNLSNAGTNLATVMIPGKALLDASEGAVYSAETPRERDFGAWIKQWLNNFAVEFLTTLKGMFGDIGLTISAIKNLINVLAGIFLKNAAPFIAAGMDFAKGLANTTDAAINAVRSWYFGRVVGILPGHPTVVVNAIERAMRASLFDGLYQTLKGAGSAAMTGLTAGAGMIINIVVAITETLIKVIWRLEEIFRMKAFFKKAKEYWAENHPEMRMKPMDFNAWFRSTALTIPCLSILTLNSGICGDKMRFLKVLKDDSNVISQDAFNRGVRFVDNLKAVGADYMNNSGFTFSSEDKVVQGLLGNMKSLGVERYQIWNGVLKVVNA